MRSGRICSGDKKTLSGDNASGPCRLQNQFPGRAIFQIIRTEGQKYLDRRTEGQKIKDRVPE